jgi:hypothetical protein
LSEKRMSPTLGQRILSLLSQSGEYVHPKGIAQTLQAPENSVRSTLRRLDEKGKVVREEPGLYAAPETARRDWLERLRYGVEVAPTRFHALCYTLRLDGSYGKTQGWTRGELDESVKTIEQTKRRITIKVFTNDNVAVYVGTTANPMDSKDIADMDELIDAIFQTLFEAHLRDYELKQVEANVDIINATLECSKKVIELRQPDRLYRIYAKALEEVPIVRLETRHYGRPLQLTDEDIKPFVTNAVLYGEIRIIKEDMKNHKKQHNTQNSLLTGISQMMRASLGATPQGERWAALEGQEGNH